MGACSLDLAAEMKNVAASRGKVTVPLSWEEKKNPTESGGADSKRAAAVPLPKESPKKTAHGSRDTAIAEPTKEKEAGATEEAASATPSAQKRPAEEGVENSASQGKKAKATPLAVESPLSPAEEKKYLDELARQLDGTKSNALVVAKPFEETQATPKATEQAVPPQKTTGAVTSPEDLQKLQTQEAKELLGAWVPWSQRAREKKDPKELLVDLKDKNDEKEDRRLEKAAVRAEKAAEKTQKQPSNPKGAAKGKAKPDAKKPAKSKQEEPEATSAAGLASKLKAQAKKSDKKK